MGRGIVVNLGGEVSEFDLTKIEREKLYGRKLRVVVDDQGRACQPALLTRDGSAVMPPGCVASLYLDDGFDVIERSELKAVGADGAPLAPVPSTLGVAQELEGPIDSAQVLDHTIASVYLLAGVQLGAALKAALEAGKIFKARFNYREDYAAQTAFLLQNECGIFALIGEPTRFEFLRRDAPGAPATAESDEGLENDLDFNMM